MNFPLILMLATFITGIVVALDKFWLAAKRAELVDESGKTPAEPFIVEQSKSFFPVLMIVFVLRSFVAEPFQIPSGSMEPGLVKGDFIVVNKFIYGLRMPVFDFTIIPITEPQRGDVMVFFPPNDPRYFIKRVIGLPGDVVEYENNRLIINGEPVPTKELAEQPYPATKTFVHEELGEHTPVIQWTKGFDNNGQAVVYAGPQTTGAEPWVVPEGFYFTMGDNRGNSADSRYWGLVPERNIVGKAEAIWLHMEEWGDMPSFHRNGRIK